MKFIARKPVVRTEVYRKYGFTYVGHDNIAKLKINILYF